MDKDDIIVNHFMFCEDHGSEFCNYCYCDHRMCNNIQIKDKLKRTPINVYQLGAVKRKKDTYECMSHKKVDCAKCFDWVRMVKQEAGVPTSEDNQTSTPLMSVD
ncbi:hypothetical protein H0H92_001303 [Tricholoma furcatifolium]|nr:hypothetical protein H0H92_001303 [Tricholoma furcatifolium]